MNNVIGIIDYGVAGNTHSITKAIIKAGGKVLLLNGSDDFSKVDKIVLPGVGTFKDAMEKLDGSGASEKLRVFDKPILGICLGMQVLANLGFEYGKTQGLSLINAEVKPILCNAKVPHMGYNTIEVIRDNPLLAGLADEEFYFMHSFEVVNYTDVASLTDYSSHKIVSAVRRGNVYGVQFHPEKSRDAGIRLFKNFIEL